MEFSPCHTFLLHLFRSRVGYTHKAALAREGLSLRLYKLFELLKWGGIKTVGAPWLVGYRPCLLHGLLHGAACGTFFCNRFSSCSMWSPASNIPSIKDEAMRALEASLASSVEHRTSLEIKLSASEQVLSAVRTKLNRSAAEAREQRAALAERDEIIAALQLKAQAREIDRVRVV